ncbi:hypothetical protein Sango_3076700 [Sesamum angolense]|uniref:Uncharacterized protein n=1 Tax=Sesamum angolense TaxID=2727404 RepID=A0AAE1W189_9LAMI|nr:hypothetical protein Sango_3076700 [Sesamum angolense]
MLLIFRTKCQKMQREWAHDHCPMSRHICNETCKIVPRPNPTQDLGPKLKNTPTTNCSSQTDKPWPWPPPPPLPPPAHPSPPPQPTTSPPTQLPNYPSQEPLQLPRPLTKLNVSSSSNPVAAATTTTTKKKEETIYFDGGAHYGDLLANLLLGFTLLWLPLTLAAVFRAFYLRYRFTNLRVTVISGLTGQDRSDFSYDVIKDVQVVPREIAKYCLAMADKPAVLKETGPKGF